MEEIKKNNWGAQLAKGDNLAEAYHEALVMLNDNGEIFPCDAYSTEYIKKVQKEVHLALCVKDVNNEPLISKFFLSGPDALQDYELEFLYGVRDFNVEAYEKGLEDNFWPYTYHQRIEENDQVDFVIDELIRDKETRRAVILIRDNETDMKVKDPACLQEFIFQIRDNKLNMTAFMRSNDATEASGMNMYAFIGFQKMMAKKIKDRALEYIDILKSELKKSPLADEGANYRETICYLNKFENLEAGMYIHEANSYHAYGEVLSKEDYRKYLENNEGITLEEDIKSGTAISYENGFVVGEIRKLQKNTQRIKNSKFDDLVYSLDGDNGWGPMMAARICPSLAELSIKKSMAYGLFDEKQVRKMEIVLEAYNIPFNELVSACDQFDVDLIKAYEGCNMHPCKRKVLK